MAKINKHIQIVRSNVNEQTSIGAKSCQDIQESLRKTYEKVEVSIVDTNQDLDAMLATAPDLVFLGMKTVPGVFNLDLVTPNIWMANLLDNHNINYTGSGSPAHSLDRNKHTAKAAVIASGLRTSAFQLVKQGSSLAESDVILNYPLFVKPDNLGGGIGIDDSSYVVNYQQLRSKIENLQKIHVGDVLVE
jgi:D-alanine-D-alanine ligase-like ATP-grasp enzyme